MVKLEEHEWWEIAQRIRSEYPPSVSLIRHVMRRELGCTIRNHQYWNPGMVVYVKEVHLDFFDEAKETWFRLKYL